MNHSRIAFYAVTFAVLAGVALNLQWLVDQYYLRVFHPAPAMSQIISELKLTGSAKGMMYRGKPQIDDKPAFNSDCQPAKGQELELGCYASGRIYVLKISNPDLSSEMEVVAAHEFLHEAYTRLSASDRHKVDGLIEQAVTQIHDTDLDARLADYAQSEPGERNNELHSILGTEFANLPPELEQYYARYFQNRSDIMAAHTQYQKVFNNRRAQIDQELSTIRQLKAQLAALNAQMSELKASGSITAYNAQVPRQNALVDQVNSLIATYNADVEEYNALSESLNSQQITPADL
jgi:hypothetical protein